MKNFFRITLILSIWLLISGILVCLTDSKSNLNLLLVAALVLLAISFRGFSLLKGFSYTVLILAAVSIAMLYPSYFFSFGNFQLKKLIVPFVQLTMFGMGSHMS
ncbi:MAG: bile acid:sodium symporter family protein, partial [Siphonobacter aquaeclarae]|nr:bile acid:sodium symporter family protein [Siphonobacter aquaeclarae]